MSTTTTARTGIAHILAAFHRPDRGQFGACTRCAHGDASGQQCQHPYAGSSGQPSALMRSSDGACRDGSLHEYARAHAHPAQQSLAI